MSLTIFLTLCILGLDFLIFVLFKWTYGDKQRAIARRVAEERKAMQSEKAGLIVVRGGKSDAAVRQTRNLKREDLFARDSYRTRIA